MSVTLICDVCRTPKDSTRHYSITESWRDLNGKPRHRSAGSIDLCEECIVRYSHDGRNSAHKVVSYQRKRLEFGKVSR